MTDYPVIASDAFIKTVRIISGWGPMSGLTDLTVIR